MNTPETPSHVRHYQDRINLVIDYIQEHLHQKLSVTELAKIACFSPFHFHRIFSAIMGETLTSFIQRLRVEKAAFMLRANPQKKITEIAFEVGFAGSASFARLFKDFFSVSASQWRRSKKSGRYANTAFLPFEAGSISRAGQTGVAAGGYFPAETVESSANLSLVNGRISVEEVPDMFVAYVRNIGPFNNHDILVEKMIARLLGWAIPKNYLHQDSLFMGMYHDDPEITDENKLRMSVCVAVPEDIKASGGIGTMRIAGGRYAVGHFKIDGPQHSSIWNYLYGQWLPRSGFECDDRPRFEKYLNNPNKDPQKKHIVDIYVPVTKPSW